MIGVIALIRQVARYVLTTLFAVIIAFITHTSGLASSFNTPLTLGTGKSGHIGASARRVILDGGLAPSSSFYVPNSFVSNGEDSFYGFLHGISRIRNINTKAGCEPDCSDAIAYAEVDVWKRSDRSFTLQYSLHSLTGRNGGTSVGEGQSMGFKFARQLSSTSAFSFSGEHIVQLDETVDLGRNYFFGYSKFVKHKLPNRIPGVGYVFNIGIGSGLYSVHDNHLFSTSSVLTGPYFSGDGKPFAEDENSLNWGIIGSAAYYLTNRVAIGAEFIGYGLGVGVSLKPFQSIPLTATGYLYDLIDNVPQGIPCAEDPCRPRLYGRLTYSF